jgi:dephospho-CoA kinase
MWIIGLTGAIGAGKSTVSQFFTQMGVPVHSADDTIHFLFDHDHEVQEQVRTSWPDVFVEGKIDRLKLGDRVLASPSELARLEGLLYPKLAENQREFLIKNQQQKKQFVVLDVPLLFEVGLDVYCDVVILVTARSPQLKQRVMRREGMTAEKYSIFKHLQMKDAERKKRADFIIYTGREKDHALKTVQKILFILSQQPIPTWQGKWPKSFKRSPYASGNRT